MSPNGIAGSPTKVHKIPQDLIRTTARHRTKFHRPLSNSVPEKLYNSFTPFTILAAQGTI